MPLRGYGDDSEKISDCFVAWTIWKFALKAIYYFVFISENSVHNLQALSAKIKVTNTFIDPVLYTCLNIPEFHYQFHLKVFKWLGKGILGVQLQYT